MLLLFSFTKTKIIWPILDGWVDTIFLNNKSYLKNFCCAVKKFNSSLQERCEDDKDGPVSGTFSFGVNDNFNFTLSFTFK